MTRLWILIAILIVIVLILAVVYVKSTIDKEDEVVETSDDAGDEVIAEVGDDATEEVVDCSGFSPQTRKNCLLARDGVAYQL